MPALLKEFTLVLNRQVQAIRQVLRDVTPDQTAAGKKSTEFDAKAASTAISHLRALLESSDGESAEAFLQVENILAGTVEKSRLEALGTAVTEFDFELALLKLNEIIKEYGVNRDQANG